MNTRLCKEAMEVAKELNVPIFAHCEDIDLRGDGCMNDDENAKRLGLPGICNAVEDCDRSKRHSSGKRDRCKASSLSLLYRRRCQNDGNCKWKKVWIISQQRFAHITLFLLQMISNVMIQITK